jgi:hypothetical protein
VLELPWKELLYVIDTPAHRTVGELGDFESLPDDEYPLVVDLARNLTDQAAGVEQTLGSDHRPLLCGDSKVVCQDYYGPRVL